MTEVCDLPTKSRDEELVDSVRIRAGLIKRIHVNQLIIKSNHVDGRYEPVLTIKGSNFNVKAHQVDIIHSEAGRTSVVYREDDPLACGAKVWVETTEEVVASIYKRTNTEVLPLG